VHELLKIFAKGDTILFSQINLKMVEAFRQFIMNAPQGGTKRGTISQNTAATYFSIFKAGLKQAFIDGYLTIDISAKVKGIQERESERVSHGRGIEPTGSNTLRPITETCCLVLCFNRNPPL